MIDFKTNQEIEKTTKQEHVYLLAKAGEDRQQRERKGGWGDRDVGVVAARCLFAPHFIQTQVLAPEVDASRHACRFVVTDKNGTLQPQTKRI